MKSRKQRHKILVISEILEKELKRVGAWSKYSCHIHRWRWGNYLELTFVYKGIKYGVAVDDRRHVWYPGYMYRDYGVYNPFLDEEVMKVLLGG